MNVKGTDTLHFPPAPSSSHLKNTYSTLSISQEEHISSASRLQHHLLSNPYLGTHVRRLRLSDNCEDDFANGISWLTHVRTPISRTLGFLPNLRSFGLNFNSTGENWDAVPDETWAAFGSVFRMESVKKA